MKYYTGARIIQFPKKGYTISLEVQTEILEDGSVWMRVKLDNDKEWGEWERVSLRQ